MPARNGVFLARAFARDSEFGGLLVYLRSVIGWAGVGGSCQRKVRSSVPRQVGRMQKEKKKSKMQPICLFAHTAMGRHGLKVGPLPPAVATALLGEAHPLFPQIPKSENRPAVPAYLPYLTCACAYARACCDRDIDRACFHFKSTLLLLLPSRHALPTAATFSLRPIQPTKPHHRGPSLSVSSTATPSTPYYPVITNSRRRDHPPETTCS